MITPVIAATCLAAIFVAGVLPVRAQTLPFYSDESVIAQCMAEVPKKSEDWVKNHAESLKRGYLKEPEKAAADLFEYRCYGFPKEDSRIGNELAKRWNAINPRIRSACALNTQVMSYSSLQECIEHFEKGAEYILRRSGDPGAD